MARTLEDAAIILEVIAGHDPKDSTSSYRSVDPYRHALGQSVKGLKVGIPDLDVEGLDPQTMALWKKGQDWLLDAGVEILPISMPHMHLALAVYYIIAPAECASNLARYDGVRYGVRVEGPSLDDLYCATRADGFGAEVKRRILIGNYVLSSASYQDYYLQAQKVRRLIAQDFTQAFFQCDALLMPTAAGPALPLSAPKRSPIEAYLEDVFTVPANLAGLPAISVPTGLSLDHSPMGLQLIGRAFDESTLLKLGYVLEQAAQFPFWSPNNAQGS
jgi:aspartyl-tRNA(Asn)/glutamyl-tRNA(Gln) amidotransferase subunit A